MRSPRYREQPNLAHYIAIDESGELHLFTDSKSKKKFTESRMKKRTSQLLEKIKESLNNTNSKT